MSFSNDGPSNPQKPETRLVTAGRDTKGQRGFVNPAVYHGSTVLYPTAEDLHAHRAEFSYGRHGSPTTRALQDVLMSLEGLGLSRGAREAVERMLRSGAGLILVTGPTGSGKTTTIYSLLHLLAGGARNIISIEDESIGHQSTFHSSHK